MDKEQILAEVAKHKATIESNNESMAKARIEIWNDYALASFCGGKEKDNAKLEKTIADLLLKLESLA